VPKYDSTFDVTQCTPDAKRLGVQNSETGVAS
jgi:hypothetical protein